MDIVESITTPVVELAKDEIKNVIKKEIGNEFTKHLAHYTLRSVFERFR